MEAIVNVVEEPKVTLAIGDGAISLGKGNPGDEVSDTISGSPVTKVTCGYVLRGTKRILELSYISTLFAEHCERVSRASRKNHFGYIPGEKCITVYKANKPAESQEWREWNRSFSTALLENDE